MLVTRSDLSKEPCNGTVALPHVHRASARGTWRTIEWHSLAECVPPSVCWKISRWRGCRWTGPKTAQIRGTYTAGHCFIKCYSLLGDIAATLCAAHSRHSRRRASVCKHTSVCPANETVDRYAIGVIYYPPSSLLRTYLRLYSYGIHDNISR